jgi:hypothetical protein
MRSDFQMHYVGEFLSDERLEGDDVAYAVCDFCELLLRHEVTPDCNAHPAHTFDAYCYTTPVLYIQLGALSSARFIDKCHACV